MSLNMLFGMQLMRTQQRDFVKSVLGEGLYLCKDKICYIFAIRFKVPLTNLSFVYLVRLFFFTHCTLNMSASPAVNPAKV